MSLLELFILSLATWRLSHLLASEDGPFDLLTRLRARFPLGGLLNCMYCLSIWIAPLLYVLMQTPAIWLVYMLAGAGGAMLAHRYTGGDFIDGRQD